MFKKSHKSKEIGFLQKLEEYAEATLPDVQKVRIAKIKFLKNNKEEIIQASEAGYGFAMIAEVATMELLKTNVPKYYPFTAKEGELIQRETKFSATEIKIFCGDTI